MSGNSWPEQEFVYEWVKKWGVELERKPLLELMERMTEPRIELQEIRTRVKRLSPKQQYRIGITRRLSGREKAARLINTFGGLEMKSKIEALSKAFNLGLEFGAKPLTGGKHDLQAALKEAIESGLKILDASEQDVQTDRLQPCPHEEWETRGRVMICSNCGDIMSPAA